jgi:hypothetical protein
VYTFLHLSDLHRSPADPISNTELISALTADIDKHCLEHPAGGPPDAIVVSGDIIQGVPIGVANADALIADQYAVALDFLASLANRFLSGDRRQIVLVPGNHDVDWNRAREAMAVASDDELPVSLRSSTFSSSADLRWSWADRKAYRIVDRGAYEDRLRAFKTFYSSFYEGTDRSLAQDPYGYFDLFQLCDDRIALAAFNSCAGNDCFCFAGHIPEDAIANAHLILRDRAKSAELRIAVWHHNIEGIPSTGDYMDLDAVNRMIGVGFRLGLHGHQHRAQLGHRYILLPETERMAVISAGSLCAGSNELPTGVNRQYNVIQLADDLASARVHIREMAVATVFGPAMRVELGGRGYVDLTWDSESFRRTATLAAASGRAARVIAAEQAWKEGRADDAKEILLSLGVISGSYERTLLLDILENTDDWAALTIQIGEPSDIAELTVLIRAHVERHEFGIAREALDRWSGSLSLPSPQRGDLEKLISVREALVAK